MSGWAIASVVGGLLGVLIVVLLVIIARAVRRTTENAGALMEALAEVRAKTLVLADLEAQSEHTSRVAAEAAAALREFSPAESEDGNDANGR